jgi:hypothetical protein
LRQTTSPPGGRRRDLREFKSRVDFDHLQCYTVPSSVNAESLSFGGHVDTPAARTDSQEIKDFVEGLSSTLEFEYSAPRTPGGHDADHIKRMLRMESKIASVLDFDPWEYRVAVWLHNLDRIEAFRAPLKQKGVFGYVERVVLEGSPFSPAARARIAYAVSRHAKKDDEPGDSSLLTALRIADKLDRLGPLGILSAAAFRGGELPLYDARSPFGYASTAEERLKSVYNDFFRVLEWVGMLPSDAARSLINREHLAAYVAFLRALGKELSDRLEVEDRVEDDIRRALGSYHAEFAKFV